MEKQRIHIPSLVMGIVAIATLWFTFGVSGVVCGVIGIVLARKARTEYRTSAGFGLSLVALVISSVLLTIFVLMLLVIILMPGSVGAYYIQAVFEAIAGKLGITYR